MYQNGHEERSRTTRSRATVAAFRPLPARAVPHERRPQPQQPPLPLVIHLAPASRRALSHLTVRPVRPADQRHGHRQHLRTRRQAALLSSRMGEKHTLFPRPPSDGPSRVAQTGLVRAFCAQRIPVFHAPARSPAPRGSWATRLAHGCRPSRRVHGPHQDLPGASGEVKSPPRGLRGVLLPESDSPLHDRCVRSIRREPHRKSPGEVTMRSGRVLPQSIPQPAHTVRETTPPSALTSHRQLTSHRATILRQASRQDADRNSDKRYAAVREFVLVAVHGDHVTYDVATAGGSLIHALRLPAVSPEPALRPVQIHQGYPRRHCDVIQRDPGEYRR